MVDSNSKGRLEAGVQVVQIPLWSIATRRDAVIGYIDRRSNSSIVDSNDTTMTNQKAWLNRVQNSSIVDSNPPLRLNLLCPATRRIKISSMVDSNAGWAVLSAISRISSKFHSIVDSKRILIIRTHWTGLVQILYSR